MLWDQGWTFRRIVPDSDNLDFQFLFSCVSLLPGEYHRL
jgi:hypothetical protein